MQKEGGLKLYVLHENWEMHLILHLRGEKLGIDFILREERSENAAQVQLKQCSKNIFENGFLHNRSGFEKEQDNPGTVTINFPAGTELHCFSLP